MAGYDARDGDAKVRQTLTFTRQGELPAGPKPLITTRGKPVEVLVDPGGTYFVEGLAPGVYRVTASPRALAREVEIEVDGAQDVLPLDLALAPRAP